MGEAIELVTSDGERLEAEICRAADPCCGVVIAHPHPLMGGDMYSPVTSALFRALDTIGDGGATGIRFNFRGAGRSTGTHDDGRAERLDVLAALDAVAAEVASADRPIVLAGWSFGADVSLSITDPRVAGWFLAAAPLRIVDPTTMAARAHPAQKRFAVPEADQFAPPDVVAERIADWTNASAEVIGGADHFFGGLMGPVTDAFTSFVAELIAAPIDG